MNLERRPPLAARTGERWEASFTDDDYRSFNGSSSDDSFAILGPVHVELGGSALQVIPSMIREEGLH